jgi:hypothetical protein
MLAHVQHEKYNLHFIELDGVSSHKPRRSGVGEGDIFAAQELKSSRSILFRSFLEVIQDRGRILDVSICEMKKQAAG